MTTVQACLEPFRVSGRLLEGELLLSHVLQIRREQVFAHPGRTLTDGQERAFRRLGARFEQGEPVAYLIGRKEFFGLEFQVDERVLIPRPETEHLVEAILNLVKEVECPAILDVGTGSGAIALALAHALPQAQVYASEISGEALEVARVNAVALDLERVTFWKSDLLKDLPWTDWNLDVMVANLPYIGQETFHFVERSVEAFEPHLALFGGHDGLQLYAQFFEQIICSIAASTFSPRYILGEFGCFQRERLEEMIRTAFPTARVNFHTDLAGLDRYFVIDRAVHSL